MHYLDQTHVALSCQFFNKSQANIQENPRAQLLVIEPGSMRQFRLDVVFERSEQSGPVFERMQARLAVIASLTGMTRVFHLRSADIYRVFECAELPPAGPAPDAAGAAWSPPDLEGIAALNELLSGCP